MPAVGTISVIAGFALTCVGVAMVFGVGWACIVGGAVLFVAGGLNEARSARPH